MQIERKLASIRKIDDLVPIPNADQIEMAVIDGWKVVVKKGEFKVDDLCVYFEIDSFLPVHPEFEFLRKSCYRNVSGMGEGFRIKTIKLRGQISQGLALPLKVLQEFGIYWESLIPPNKWSNSSGHVPHEVGADCTAYLGVIKYDPPINAAVLAGDAAGNFPSFIPKTDQERIQNCFREISRDFKNTFFEVSMKLDGTSMTVFFNDGHFGVCSRNLELKENDGAYWSVVKKLDLQNKLTDLGINLAIQGELMGPGIQKNREGLKELQFFVFDVFLIDRREYMFPYQRREFVSDLGLDHVPIVNVSGETEESVEDFLAKAEIPSINHPIAEGIVYKSILDPNTSFKVISNKFLLKEED